MWSAMRDALCALEKTYTVRYVSRWSWLLCCVGPQCLTYLRLFDLDINESSEFKSPTIVLKLFNIPFNSLHCFLCFEGCGVRLMVIISLSFVESFINVEYPSLPL